MLRCRGAPFSSARPFAAVSNPRRLAVRSPRRDGGGRAPPGDHGCRAGGYGDLGTRWRMAMHKDLTTTMLLDESPPFVPESPEFMTVLLEVPPGDPGIPPHRHSGPLSAYVLEGEMLFELEGQPERVVRAGEAVYEPGGDVIHYQAANNRPDTAEAPRSAIRRP